MSSLRVPRAHVHFLDLPDGRLRRHVAELRTATRGLVESLRPDYVLVPFRYDRHADHVALNRAAVSAADQGRPPPGAGHEAAEDQAVALVRRVRRA
jgi:LmbE family N-acetylglucosaminyl deacetylase